MKPDLWRERNPWRKTYDSAKLRCRPDKAYGLKGIKFLMSVEDFKHLWIRDKADLMERPSIDRIDNLGNYIVRNCRYIELKDNTGRNLRKKINKLSPDGKLLKTYDSILSAIKEHGNSYSMVYDCLKGRRELAYGYRWQYVAIGK